MENQLFYMGFDLASREDPRTWSLTLPGEKPPFACGMGSLDKLCVCGGVDSGGFMAVLKRGNGRRQRKFLAELPIHSLHLPF